LFNLLKIFEMKIVKFFVVILTISFSNLVYSQDYDYSDEYLIFYTKYPSKMFVDKEVVYVDAISGANIKHFLNLKLDEGIVNTLALNLIKNPQKWRLAEDKINIILTHSGAVVLSKHEKNWFINYDSRLDYELIFGARIYSLRE